MSDSYSLEYVLWNNTNNHDKIWGWVRTPAGNLFCFWGRRQVVDRSGLTLEGKRPSLTFKKHVSREELNKLRYAKCRKGYQEIPANKLESFVPGFTEFFNYALTTARMLGKVKTDDWDA